MNTTMPRRRGPVATAGRVRVTLYLDEPLADWGKHQDGGLSELVRRLLAEAQSDGAQEHASPNPYPAELRATYRLLIDRKLRVGLNVDEEQQLSEIRSRVNQLDRSSNTWQEREVAAATVDQELSDLRQEIENLPELTTIGAPPATGE